MGSPAGLDQLDDGVLLGARDPERLFTVGEQPVPNGVEHGIQEKTHRSKQDHSEQRTRERHVHHRDENQDQHIVEVQQGCETERRAKCQSGRDLSRGAVRIEGLDQFLEQSNQQHDLRWSGGGGV